MEVEAKSSVEAQLKEEMELRESNNTQSQNPVIYALSELQSESNRCIMLAGFGGNGTEIVQETARRIEDESNTEKLADSFWLSRIGFNPGRMETTYSEQLKEASGQISNPDVVLLVVSDDDPSVFEMTKSFLRNFKRDSCITIGLLTYPQASNNTTLDAVTNYQKLENSLDSIMILPEAYLQSNQKLESVSENELSIPARIIGLVCTEPQPCVDWNDIKECLKSKNRLSAGLGRGNGKQGLKEAVKQSITTGWYSDLSIKDAKSLIIQVQTGDRYSLNEAECAVGTIMEMITEHTDVVFLHYTDSAFNDRCEVFLLAGYEA